VSISTLSDVLSAVVARYAAVGDQRSPSTPNGVALYIGERWLPQGTTDAPPRIVFVQTQDGGKVTGPPKFGYIAGITESVRCYVWGLPNATDALRYDDAKRRVMRLLNVFRAVSPGRIVSANLQRGIDANGESYGEEYRVTLSYTWGVPIDKAIWAVPLVAPGAQPPDPDKPNGDTGKTFEIDIENMTNERP
jgi:hypothetical protein